VFIFINFHASAPEAKIERISQESTLCAAAAAAPPVSATAACDVHIVRAHIYGAERKIRVHADNKEIL